MKKTVRHWGLMNAMFRKAGVDLGLSLVDDRIDVPEVAEAVARCKDCTDVPGCEGHLADRQSRGVPPYCRNAELIARLAP
jgi:hypothetical protein